MRSTAPGQRLLKDRPEHLEIDGLRVKLELIAEIAQPLQPLLDIENLACPAIRVLPSITAISGSEPKIAAACEGNRGPQVRFKGLRSHISVASSRSALVRERHLNIKEEPTTSHSMMLHCWTLRVLSQHNMNYILMNDRKA